MVLVDFADQRSLAGPNVLLVWRVQRQCLPGGIARLVGLGSDKFSKCIGSSWFNKFGWCVGFCQTGESAECNMLGGYDKVCMFEVSAGFNNLPGAAGVAGLSG